MKDKVVTIAGMALLLVLGLSAWTQAHPVRRARAAQPASETRRITVSGEGGARRARRDDRYPGRRDLKQGHAAARNENDGIVKRVLALADDLGIPASTQTDYVSIEPRYRNGYYERDFVGYFVHKNIVVTLRDWPGSRTCWRGTDAGANYIHGIGFAPPSCASIATRPVPCHRGSPAKPGHGR